MFETITKHVRENSVVRFLLSHLIILLAALLICAVGFRSAFVIVRNDVLDSTMFAMTQAVSSVDNGLTELHAGHADRPQRVNLSVGKSAPHRR